MPNLRKKDEVIAILCSDVHLSHRPPAAREEESDWYGVMKRTLQELELMTEAYNASVIIAGDIFDTPDPPSQLVNFAIEWLPRGTYAVAGQHDLFYYNMENIHKTAYWTLVKAGAILHLGKEAGYLRRGNVKVHGASWGEGIPSPPKRDKYKHIAVVHKYIWSEGCRYPNAPPSSHVQKLEDDLKGYNAAVFGDNHKTFRVVVGECRVLNSGSLIRRNSDEVDHQPAVGLLRSDMTIDIKHLRCAEEDIINPKPTTPDSQEVSREIKKFLKQVARLKVASLDYIQSVIEYMKVNDLPKDVNDCLAEAIKDLK